MISFNGQSISYNSSGYPASYKGKTLTWYATVLKKYGTTEYEYTADKVRYKKKTSDGTEHTYYYEGTRLMGEKVVKKDGTEYTLEYFYDERGIMGVRHNKTPYIFVKNIQGDIVAIYDLFGKVAEYVYDAWGNCTVAYSGNEIAQINPIRYRGYYYDTDSKLYYLITRYYDPETGRFISPDGIEYLAPEQLNGLNLYAYCNNNPVMGYDPEGTLEWWHWIIGISLVAATTLAMVATAGLAATIIGASASVSSAMTVGAGIATATAGVVNLVSQSSQDVEEFDLGSLMSDMLISGISGTIAGGVGGFIGNLSSGLMGGTKLLVHKGLQVISNIIISNVFYISQSVITGSDISLYGMAIATLGGTFSGLTFNFNSISSFFLSLGIEIAGNGETLLYSLKNLLR